MVLQWDTMCPKDADKMGSSVDPDPKEQSDFCPVLSV